MNWVGLLGGQSEVFIVLGIRFLTASTGVNRLASHPELSACNSPERYFNFRDRFGTQLDDKIPKKASDATVATDTSTTPSLRNTEVVVVGIEVGEANQSVSMDYRYSETGKDMKEILEWIQRRDVDLEDIAQLAAVLGEIKAGGHY